MKAKVSLLLLSVVVAFSTLTACEPDESYTNENNALLAGTWVEEDLISSDLAEYYIFAADGTGSHKYQNVSDPNGGTYITKDFTFDFDGELLTVQYTEEGDGYNYLCTLSGNTMTLTTTAYIYKDGHADTDVKPQKRIFKRMRVES